MAAHVLQIVSAMGGADGNLQTTLSVYLRFASRPTDMHANLPAPCSNQTLFSCLKTELPEHNYTTPIQAWLEVYPREQLLLLQYESLTAPEQEAEQLKAVKRWAPDFVVLLKARCTFAASC